MTKKIKSPFLLGVDEAGRGSWAGPVVAAACALQEGQEYPFANFLRDSKQLSPKKREEIFAMIQESMKLGQCFVWVGVIGSDIIDQIGIREANRRAMEESIRQVLIRMEYDYGIIKIDGRDNYGFPGIAPERVKYIVRGDTFVPEIQAASILAKVSRDHIMEELAIFYPEYGFEKHKWYGTRLHEKNLELHRPSVLHRKSYAPIKKLILEREWIW